MWFTECSGGEWKPQWAETLPWMMRNLIIGSTRHGARGVLMWNLALDPAYGPHLGGCKDCRGVVTMTKPVSGRYPGAEAMMGAMGAGTSAAVLAAPGEGDPYKDMGLSRNALCPCGSGEKYKHCHGAAG